MQIEFTETTRFAVFVFTGRGANTRRKLLCSEWAGPSREYLVALMHGASLCAWANGLKHPTVAAYVRDTRDGAGSPWILFEEHDGDNGRWIPRQMTPDLSDGFDPMTGKTWKELGSGARALATL